MAVGGFTLAVAAEPAIEFNVDGELVGLKTPGRFCVGAKLRLRVPPATDRSARR